MSLFIVLYILSIAFVALTIGWAALLARKSGRRIHQVFFFLVLVNDMVGLSEVLFRFLPARVGPSPGGSASLIGGFLNFPLMAAFSYLALDFLTSLAGKPFPKSLKLSYGGYWGLLFLGFLAAQVRMIGYRDTRLTNLLMPFFNVAIMASGLGGALFAFWRGRRMSDAGERRLVCVVSGYLFVFFLIYGVLYFFPLSFVPEWRLPIRILLGFAYLLPPLIWLSRRFNETRSALLTHLAGEFEFLDGWLEEKGLSPRERQITRCVLEGKSNKAIEGELFISGRTVESHLYSIYRKLGVKNRLQLARLAAVEAESQK